MGAEDWDDEALAKRCVARDEAAWLELWRRAGPAAQAMMRRAFARAGLPDSRREAEEALGELAARLLSRDAALLRAFRPASTLKAYLAVIGRSVALEILKHRKPAQSLETVPAEALFIPPRESPVNAERLEEALSRLPERDRLALRLAYWDRRSYEEIAGVLGLSPGAVGPLLSRAREALGKLIGETEKTRPDSDSPR